MNRPQSDDIFDVIIIGAGPGGLSAGLYAARANLRTVILERGIPGGQVLLTWKVDNYPGFPGGGGADLMAVMEKQARDAGCSFIVDEVVDARLAGPVKEIVTAGGTIRGRGVIIAAGARANRLGVPGEGEFIGRGVSYCGTCDGAFFAGLPVAVVGGGDTAVEEAVFLTRFASKLTLVHRRDSLRAKAREQQELFDKPGVAFAWDSVVEEILGDASGVSGVRLRNVKSGETSRLDVQGVFIFVGVTPNSEFLKGKVTLDGAGFVPTDAVGRTDVPGVYAVGDIRAKEMRQIVTAAAEGATAAWHLDRDLRAG
jgi:thioredoxin reductase (NADPH)